MKAALFDLMTRHDLVDSFSSGSPRAGDVDMG